MKVILSTAICAVLASASAAEAQQRQSPTPAQSRLIARYNAENVACRGGRGDEPETVQACARRDEIERRMTEDHNLCFSNLGWRPCAQPQAAYSRMTRQETTGAYTISTMESAPGSCLLHRRFATSGNPELSILVTRSSGLTVVVSKVGWSYRNLAAYYEHHIALDNEVWDGGAMNGVVVASSVDTARRSGLAMKPSALFLSEFASARTLRLYRGTVLLVGLDLVGSAAAVSKLRDCMVEQDIVLS